MCGRKTTVTPVCVSVCVCVRARVGACAKGFGRLKVTLIALLRPAHLPQSVRNQSCSVKHTSLAISESIWCAPGSARARHTLAVISPTFVLSDVHKFSKEMLAVFAAFKKKRRPLWGVLFLLFLLQEKASHSGIIISMEVVFGGTSINRD